MARATPFQSAVAGSDLSEAQARRVLSFWDDGADTPSIAVVLDVAEAHVANFLARYRDAVHASRIPPRPHRAVVPGWVTNAGLTHEYKSVRCASGEHAAAAHCRRLTAEMRSVTP